MSPEELLPDDEEQAPRPKPKERRSVVRDGRRWLRGALLDNFALKLVALILAVTLFIIVNTDKEQVIVASVGVSYTMPEDRVLVSKPLDQVRLTIEGPWRSIKQFDERELERIHIDLSNRRDGEIHFSEEMIKLPPGLDLLAINPPSMELEFDEMDEKNISVNVARSGRPERGYKVETIVANPALVTVRGAKQVVSSLSAVRTREVNLRGREESFTEEVGLVTPKEYVEIVGDPTIEVSVTLEEEQITRTFTREVVTRPATYTVPEDAVGSLHTEPAEVTVTLQGAMLVLEAIEAEDVVPYVEIFSDDVVEFEPRPALVAVDLPESGDVRYNITPARVTLKQR